MPMIVKKPSLAEKLKANQVKTPADQQPPHLIVRARAGTGKTTTLLQGLKLVFGGKPDLTPSPQQKAVWDSMALSAGKVRSCAFVAFNRSIAQELKGKVPPGVDAMTNHGMGYKAVLRAFPGVRVDEYRVDNIVTELLGYEDDVRECRKANRSTMHAVREVVGLCKMNLLLTQGEEATADERSQAIERLVEEYGLEIECPMTSVVDLVPKVLDMCKDVADDRTIDFDDMIWLPVVLGLHVFKYDLLLVDEAQDLNRCQQELVLLAGKRIILCGDPRQAIYGFAGADSKSMDRMAERLGNQRCPSCGTQYSGNKVCSCGSEWMVIPAGCEILPLTVTRRCGKAIVREAQRLVPDFEAFEANGEGEVDTMRFANDPSNPTGWYRMWVKSGDMVLCRVNAPLVTECFGFIKAGKKANIQGREIGQGLIKLVNKLVNDDQTLPVEKLIGLVEDWRDDEVRKEQARKNPSEVKIQGILDKADCLLCFCQQCKASDGAAAVVLKIQSVFTDDKEGKGIRLSSIHKAKGLEAPNVFFINTEKAGCPHPMAKTPAAREQEDNLLYVGITRAIERLVWVR